MIAGDCHGQGADGGGLIDDEQNLAVYLEFGDEGAQSGLIVAQRFVVQALSVSIEGDGMMVAFADIDADEYIDGAMLLFFVHRRFCRMSGLPCNNGGKSRHHVTDGLKMFQPAPISSPATHQVR